MQFPDLTITRETRKKNRRLPVKTRRFTVTLLGHVTANSLWDLGSNGSAIRPAWIAYLGSEQGCRAFTANFRAGRKAKAAGDVFEMPKKAPHRWLHHRHGESLLTVAYLPALFHLEPQIAPQDITFLFMPPAWWIDEQAEALRGDFGEEASDAARAALFTAFLDRRSPLPIVHDLRFHLDLYRAALEEPWTEGASCRSRLSQERVTACGLDAPLLCRTSHEVFEGFLKRLTSRYYEDEIRRARARLAPKGRLLPYPEPSPRQLALEFVA